MEYTAIATQTDSSELVNSETQSETSQKFYITADKAVQSAPTTATTGTNSEKSTVNDESAQTDLIYYVTLLDQLNRISEQLTVNRTDLTSCMQWIGECEQATLVTTQTVENLTQLIQGLWEATHADVRQQLDKHRTDIICDVQFQLNLLAETFEQNCILHQQHQEAQQPPWEWFPYQCRTRSRQQYWNRRVRQDQFWCDVRDREQAEQPMPTPDQLQMPDLEE